MALPDSYNVPLSAQAREIFHKSMLEGEIEVVKRLSEELSSPRDKAFAKFLMTEYYLYARNTTEILKLLREIEAINRHLSDDFLTFLTYLGYYLLYRVLQVNRERGNKYSTLVQSLYKKMMFIDEWEEVFIHYLYFFLYLVMGQPDKTPADIQRKIVNGKKGLKFLAEIDERGPDMATVLQANLGYLYFQKGDFKKADAYLQASYEVMTKYENRRSPHILGTMAENYMLLGNPQQAHYYNDKMLDSAQKYNQVDQIIFALIYRGKISFLEGKYEDALISFVKSQEFWNMSTQPMLVFSGHYHLFLFYYELYQVQGNPDDFKEAKKCLENLQRISNLNPDNDRLAYLTRLCQALILKHGTFKNKAEAIEIFEELLEFKELGREDFLRIALNFLDLLFENVTLSEEEGLFIQIEEIIQKVETLPLQANLNVIYFYVTQQLLIVKYYYYLKNDISQALSLLTSVKDKLKQYQLKNLEQLIDKELNTFLQEKQKWERLDIPLKARVDALEFQTYLKDALHLVRHQAEK
jgi:hypothetical protein